MTDGFQLVTRSPWWSRVWTIQETVLPTANFFFIYCYWKLPWATLETAIKNQNQCIHNCCDQIYSQINRELPIDIRDSIRVIQRIEGLCSVLQCKILTQCNLNRLALSKWLAGIAIFLELDPSRLRFCHYIAKFCLAVTKWIRFSVH
jgi:hypothetical protein